jgi:hypothetical protein
MEVDKELAQESLLMPLSMTTNEKPTGEDNLKVQ